jgi:hypothetical protein
MSKVSAATSSRSQYRAPPNHSTAIAPINPQDAVGCRAILGAKVSEWMGGLNSKEEVVNNNRKGTKWPCLKLEGVDVRIVRYGIAHLQGVVPPLCGAYLTFSRFSSVQRDLKSHAFTSRRRISSNRPLIFLRGLKFILKRRQLSTIYLNQ